MDLDTCETFISKLDVEDGQIYVKVLWKQTVLSLFDIQVYHGDCTWSGSFTDELLKEFCERDNINEIEDVYALNVKKALMGDDENYIFEFIVDMQNPDLASLGWKKKFSGVNILHGKVPVHRDQNPEPITTLTDILINLNSDLKIDLKDLNKKTDKLAADLEICKNELEKFVNIKTSVESTLYGKFIQVLNAKKRRIQLLEDNLLNFEDPSSVTMTSELD